jgi:hypothetical protein
MIARSNFSSCETCLTAADGYQDMRQLWLSVAADVAMLKLAAEEGWIRSLSSSVQIAGRSFMLAVSRKPIQADELAGVCSNCLAWLSHKTPVDCDSTDFDCLQEVHAVVGGMGSSSTSRADCLQCLASKDPLDIIGAGGMVPWLRGRARYQLTCILLKARVPKPPALHVAALPLQRQQQLRLRGFKPRHVSGANDTAATTSWLSSTSGEHVLLGAKEVQSLRKLVDVHMGYLVKSTRTPGFGEIPALQHLVFKLLIGCLVFVCYWGVDVDVTVKCVS